ncbi:hydroxymethylglutaryl-CoA reductase [Amycolatopsis sp. Hca4]|uniref:hydroxymethylglutaryl-CoA reductase n=1 Tax=Amycolatopsis sp. Hca4 TaxID=2742131 RepID=UPI001591BBB0|nr:hydroxymethylglutaryl-CoA reductase [Amycolatopsis sp. Hca4]QKV74039.1 hydroxymethylglutaryl-CoA reductase [Amycolatopsis sp. Hca4]
MHISRTSRRQREELLAALLAHDEELIAALETTLTESEVAGNVENFVGAVPVPLGLCGPVLVHGRHAVGEFVVPMATMEGALVASYSRGAKMLRASGGCEVLVTADRFLRGIHCRVDTLDDAQALVVWCRAQEAVLSAVAEKTSGHLLVQRFGYDHVGSTVLVSAEFTTGDAMGSNMASKAIAAVSEYIVAHSGVEVETFLPYPEDKKPIPGRLKGKAVTARAVLAADVVASHGRTDVARVDRYVQAYRSTLARHGSSSLNIHVVNGMAALFQAFGQDMAYLGECSQGIVDSRVTSGGDWEISLTLPTLVVGTVGGGTGLPAFQATLGMVDCVGSEKARKLAEIIAAVLLAGEVGCAIAQCAGEFVAAHEALGRNSPVSAH